MARPCSICGHPDREAIDKALQAGASNREIARQHLGDPAAKDSIRRHRRHLGEPTPRKPRGRTEAATSSARSEPEKGPKRRTVVHRDIKPEKGPQKRPAPTAPAASEAAENAAPEAPAQPPEKPSQSGSDGALSREARVRQIMALMAARRWQGDEHEALAAEWGITPGTVEHYAGEASRRVRAVMEGEHTWVRTRVGVALDHGLDLAIQQAEAGDSRALSALAQLARSVRELFAPHGKGGDGRQDEPAVFRVELSMPERPTTEAPEVNQPAKS
jgi:hypothetical protein